MHVLQSRQNGSLAEPFIHLWRLENRLKCGTIRYCRLFCNVVIMATLVWFGWPRRVWVTGARKPLFPYRELNPGPTECNFIVYLLSLTESKKIEIEKATTIQILSQGSFHKLWNPCPIYRPIASRSALYLVRAHPYCSIQQWVNDRHRFHYDSRNLSRLV